MTRSTGQQQSTADTHTCASCEVTWTSYDAACWMCGRTADALTDSGADSGANRFADPTRPPRTATVHAVSIGSPGTRQADILRAHAMGLPDPRYPARAGA